MSATGAFKQLAAVNPSLVSQMRASANPAGFAYKAAADHQKMAELAKIGDPVAYEAKLRTDIEADIRAKVEAEYAAKEKEKVEAAIKAKLKGGFSEQRSVGNERTTSKTFDGPTPMGSILK